MINSWEGKGAAQDFVLAHMWLNLAAAQGDQTGVASRAKLNELMTREQIAQAQELARNWKPKPRASARSAAEPR